MAVRDALRDTRRGDIISCLLLGALTLGVIAACSSSDNNSGGGAGPAGCSRAPDCSKCGQCFDACLCQTGDAQGCLAQCTGNAGGSGGSNVGGAGGVATGGAGGGTGATGGNPSGGAGGGGGQCTQLSTNNPTCDACIHSSCCNEINGCLADSACLGLNDCLAQSCANSSNINACAQQYCSQYFSGVNAFNAMGTCFQNNCSGSC